MIEVCKSQDGASSFDRGWGMPFLDDREFHGVHVDKTLSNDHPKILCGVCVKGAL